MLAHVADHAPPPSESGGLRHSPEAELGHMKARGDAKTKANRAKLQDPARNACLEWHARCRIATEPDAGGLTPSSAQLVGNTAASASAASLQLPTEPTVALEDPTSLDTNGGPEKLAPEKSSWR